MAYDEALADRIRRVLGPRPDVTEKQMFGGLAFLLDGKMFCGLAKGRLMVRVGAERHAEALARPHVRPMDFTGRPMTGYVYVDPAGYRTDRTLAAWIGRGTEAVTKRPINAAWHDAHPMPRRATLEQRVAWHVAHRGRCGCRPIPASLLAHVPARRTPRG